MNGHLNANVSFLRRSLIVQLLCTVGLVLGAQVESVRAEPQSALEQCWSPDELKAKPGERRIRRGIRAHDASPSIDGPETVATVEPALKGVIRRVKLPEGQSLVALTVDFCEQAGEIAGYDGAIIDYLRAEKIPATLFAGGKWLRSHNERAQQLLADPLFELANHGDAHRNVRRLSAARRRTEILGPQAAYSAIKRDLSERACTKEPTGRMEAVPEAMRLFRFPFGICSPDTIQAVNSAGMVVIQWDISTGDAWRGQSANRISSTVLQRIQPGSIILAHGNGRGWHTAQGLRKLIPALRQRGYSFVTVSDLLAAGQPVIDQRCYDTRPGDTNAWAGKPRHHRRRKVRQRRSQPIAQPYWIP